MKLVHEIIEILSSSNPDLADALAKAQVVAHKLGERELTAWIRGELVGYAQGVDVPDYRILHVTIYGNVANFSRRYSNYLLSTIGVPEKIRDKLLTRRIWNSISVIQGWASSNGIKSPIEPQYFPFFMKGIDDSYQIESAWGEFSAGAFTQIIVEVRSRLLDFMLNLSDKLPQTDDADVKALSKEINVNELFEDAVFGDGVTLNVAVGSNNSANQHVVQNIKKGNTESLRLELLRHSVPPTDMDELGAAILDDDGSEEHARQEFGPGVRKWIGGMLSKAGTASFGLSTQVAAGVLAAAIGKYYGFA